VKPLILGIVGVGAVQINSALDAIFARIADLSGPAYLWYAIRLEQLPLALFGIALSSALLPSLSRAIQAKDFVQYRSLLEEGLRYSMALMIPCSFALWVLGAPAINLLYGRGQFSVSDVQETLLCLWGYGWGLVPSVATLLLASGSYARSSYVHPALASLLSVMFHISCNIFLVFGLHWGAVSIAVSTSLAAYCNCLLLARSLYTTVGSLVSRAFWGYCLRLIVASLFAGGVVWMTPWCGQNFPRDFSTQLMQLAGATALFGVAFFTAAFLLKVHELFVLFQRQEAPMDWE
jgi:putative peptidoglycan lipid II flippase